MSGSQWQDSLGRCVAMCPKHDNVDAATEAIRAMAPTPDAEGYPFGVPRQHAALVGDGWKCDHPSHREEGSSDDARMRA